MEAFNGKWDVTKKTHQLVCTSTSFLEKEKVCSNTMIRTLQWDHPPILGAGGYGVVYALPQNLAIKVGRIESTGMFDEITPQKLMAQYGLALPVLAFFPQVIVPDAVCRDLCGIHGVRVQSGPCSCRERVHSALLMPQAFSPIGHFSCKEREKWRTAFEDFYLFHIGRQWHGEEGAILMYQGRLVAIDFGVP